MADPSNQPAPHWWRSPAFTLVASIVLAAAATGYLLMISKPFGALAIGGANALALALYFFIREPINTLVRNQTAAEAAISWCTSIAWTIGVVVLFQYDLRLLGVLAVSAVLLIYMLACWLVVTGRVSDEHSASP